MVCKECIERREKLIDAVIEGRIAAAAGHAIKGAVEMVGMKQKTATVEVDIIQPDGGVERAAYNAAPEMLPKKRQSPRS